MAETGILNLRPVGARRGQVRLASTRIPLRLCALLAMLLQVMSSNAWSEVSTGWLEEQTAAEQYRQYNLVVMVAEGMDPAFLQELQSAGPAHADAAEDQFPQINVDDFQTPLNRIVDQDALISNALNVIRFVQDHREAILGALDTIAQTQPGAVAEVNLVELAEDAIIVRIALSSALEYAPGGNDEARTGYLQAYQAKTVYLRNVMEYWAFSEELDGITEDAMDSTGGRMEAYQRLLEDEPAMDSFKQHLDAVENVYWLARNKKGKPPKLPGDELIDSEAKVH